MPIQWDGEGGANSEGWGKGMQIQWGGEGCKTHLT